MKYPTFKNGWTGLKDKNGNDIKWGDSLRRDSRHNALGYDPRPYVLDTFEGGSFWFTHQTKQDQKEFYPYKVSADVVSSQSSQFVILEDK